MAETLPRWNLPEISFVETDPEKIKAEIITNYEAAANRTLANSDPVRLFLLSIANEIIHQRTLINYAAKNNLLSYAEGEYLDALGVYLGVTRLAAAPAVCEFEFYLSEELAENYIIPAGTEITNGVVTFATSKELIIDAGEISGKVSGACVVPGVDGNEYLPGQISTIVRPLPFISKVENTTETQGGADKEQDKDYAERIRLAPNSFSVAGPLKAYRFHTFSASPAVSDVSIDSPTPGVVNVYPLLNGGEIPGEDLRKNIQAYLSAEDRRPLTDQVNVLPANAVNYEIKVSYYLRNEDKNIADSIREKIAAAVENYRQWQQGKIGRDIVPAKLISLVMNAGASRLGEITPANYERLDATQVAQCPPENITISFIDYDDE